MPGLGTSVIGAYLNSTAGTQADLEAELESHLEKQQLIDERRHFQDVMDEMFFDDLRHRHEEDYHLDTRDDPYEDFHQTRAPENDYPAHWNLDYNDCLSFDEWRDEYLLDRALDAVDMDVERIMRRADSRQCRRLRSRPFQTRSRTCGNGWDQTTWKRHRKHRWSRLRHGYIHG